MARIGVQLHCTVVTPESLVVDAEVFEVVLPGHDGLVGILPGHAPMLCQLAPGLLRFHEVGLTRATVMFLEAGLFHVREDELTVLTPAAIRREDLTFAQVEQMLQDVESMPTATIEQVAARAAVQARTSTLLKLVRR